MQEHNKLELDIGEMACPECLKDLTPKDARGCAAFAVCENDKCPIHSVLIITNHWDVYELAIGHLVMAEAMLKAVEGYIGASEALAFKSHAYMLTSNTTSLKDKLIQLKDELYRREEN